MPGPSLFRGLVKNVTGGNVWTSCFNARGDLVMGKNGRDLTAIEPRDRSSETPPGKCQLGGLDGGAVVVVVGRVESEVTACALFSHLLPVCDTQTSAGPVAGLLAKRQPTPRSSCLGWPQKQVALHSPP